MTIIDLETALTRGIAMIKQFPVLSAMVAVMVLAVIGIIFYMYVNATTGIPIAVSRIESGDFSNYSGFTDKPEADDAQHFSYRTVTIANTSKDKKVALAFF